MQAKKYCKNCKQVLTWRKFGNVVRELLMKWLQILLFLLLIVPKVNAAGVAVVAPKDGDEAKFGRQLKDGVKIAVDVINESGGLMGEKVELINIDDVCSESSLFGERQKLRTGEGSGVNLVIGPYCTGTAVHDMIKDEKTVRIMPQPLTNSWYNYDRGGLFKIGGRVAEQAKTFFDVYKNQWIDKNVAVVYDKNDAASYEVAAEVQSIFNANDLTNRISLYDFSAYDNKYKKMAKEIVRKSNVAYILGNKKQITSLAEKLQERDENFILIIDEYMATGYFFKEMGNFAEGVYLLRINDQKSNAHFTKELVELRIKNKEPYGLGVMGYAAVMMWVEMVKKAGSFEANVIDKVSVQREWNLPWGDVRFQHGRTLTNGGWNMYRFADGEYTQVN